MKKHSATKLLFVMLLAGLCLLSACTPFGNMHLGEVEAYKRVAASGMDFTALWEAAHEYNESLVGVDILRRLTVPKDVGPLLRLPDNDIMGVIEIPAIDVKVPFYHSSDDAKPPEMCVHLSGTSLPTGGENTHCALTVWSKRDPVNLDQLWHGDIFVLRVLDSVQTYEIDQIVIVLPEQTEELEIFEGESCCSLITGTPYGVNSHRLIVRGRLVEMAQAEDFPEEEVNTR